MRQETEWVIATIAAVRDVAPGIRELMIETEAGVTAYSTGSHIQLRVLINGRPEVRHYSLIGDRPQSGAWRIAVKREDPGRGGSRYMWSLQPGARIETSRPISQFELSNSPVARLLIAGGIGITPVYGIAEALQRRNLPYRLLYAGRSRGTMAFIPDLEAICGNALEIVAEDEVGHPDLAGAIARLPADGEAYVCGPIGLLDAVRRAWRSAGRQPARLVYESFGTSGLHPTEAFRVSLPRLGLDVEVSQNSTILESLEAAGVGVLSDCRRGECGLCQMTVLNIVGALDHRDVFFSDEERHKSEKICACVSRVTGGGIVTLEPAWRGDRKMKSGIELRRLDAVAEP